MAGVYTDNQPDFSFLAPGENKAFSQFWYPITEDWRSAGGDPACRDEYQDGGRSRIHVGISATEDFPQAQILLERAGTDAGGMEAANHRCAAAFS